MKPIQLDRQQRQELQRRRHQTPDTRIYERLSAVLWVADGKTRCEVADLLGRSVRQLAEWLRLFGNLGLDALCALHHRGDPGNLSAGQVEPQAGDQHGALPQLRSGPPLGRGGVRGPVRPQWHQGPAAPRRRELSHDDRLLVESRSGQAA